MALVAAVVCLVTNAKALAVRVHTMYAATAAWWLFSMAMIAGAETPSRAQYWARFALLGVGMLPAVVYHVNVAVAGREHAYRRRILVHYALAAVVTLFCLTGAPLMSAPYTYRWGPYPAYTAWGLVPLCALLVVFAEVAWLYRAAIASYEPGTPERERARAYHYGNYFAFLAAADFLPAFGVPVYPFGYINLALMFTATMFGAARYRQIEITPEIAADSILQTIPDGLLVVDARRRVRIANSAAARLLGRPLVALVDQPLDSVSADLGLRRVLTAPAVDDAAGEDVRFTASDGAVHDVTVASAGVLDGSGSQVARAWLLRDMTMQRRAEEERNRLEGWVRQTQKMESLGVMAGGIAHDFNNVLMAILGNAELARFNLDQGRPAAEELRAISSSAEQAAELTDQLLTYAGRGTSIEGAVDLNALCRDMTDLIRSAISRKASFSLELASPLPAVHADRSQLRQVILNLVTNASDALGDSEGAITIRTGVVGPGESAATDSPGTAPALGRRVTLEVVDTGAGLDEATRARMFDPFFTTKFAGRGLGLATVLRIVQGHRGVIEVTSAPGAGSHFVVSFPSLGVGAEVAQVDPIAASDWTGKGTVVLADDEDAVRRVVRTMLVELGFDVIEAADGAQAVEAFRARSSGVAAVVLDVTMPRMDGREAAAEIRRLSPSVPVLFISGFADAAAPVAVDDGRTAFLHKPFKRAALAASVREAMADPGAVASP